MKLTVASFQMTSLGKGFKADLAARVLEVLPGAVSPLHPLVPHPWIQITVHRKHFGEKNFQRVPKSKTCCMLRTVQTYTNEMVSRNCIRCDE